MSRLRFLLVLAWFVSWPTPVHADTAAAVRAALASGQPALIEFGAETCSQCKRMKVVLDGCWRAPKTDHIGGGMRVEF